MSSSIVVLDVVRQFPSPLAKFFRQRGQSPAPTKGRFSEDGTLRQVRLTCNDCERFSQKLDRLRRHVTELRARLRLPDDRLGQRVD